MTERIRMAGFGEGAPEYDQMLEAAVRLARDGGSRGPLMATWSDDRKMVVLCNKNGGIEMVINPTDFVSLGGQLPP